MLVIRLDDTLLTDDHTISVENAEQVVLRHRNLSLCYSGGKTNASKMIA
jgi:hydroxymethylpyrimidine pyrophosphatase-like HAD family hydrolase